MNIAGANPSVALTTTEYAQGKGFGLGDRLVEHNGKEWVFIQATTAITGAGYLVIYDENYAGVMVTTSNDATGDQLGVPAVAAGSSDYLWVQVKGPSSVLCVAATVANTKLNTTATAGQLDDNGSASAGLEAVGIVVTTSSASSAQGLNPCMLSYPRCGAAV